MAERRYARISGVGMYLPEKVITNEELGAMTGHDVDGWLRPRTGIPLRHVSAPDEAPSDMAVKAAEEAIKNAGLEPEDIDLLMMTTDTPDYVTPPTSTIIQHKLGAKNAGCFDINAACCDQTIALAVGSHYIMLDPAIDHVLIVAPYAMTKWVDWSIPYLHWLFGDGAGAVVLSVSDEPGYLASKIIADGSYWDCYGVYVGAANPITLDMVKENKHILRWHESGHRYPADVNEARWHKLIRETVEKAGYKVEDLDMVFLTQVNVNSIKVTMEKLGLPLSKTHWITEKWGYCGSACVFMALYDALKQGKIKKGDLICFCASGVGFIMATALFRWV